MTALDGVTVIDLGHVTAGPLATWLLSSLGADVVKIERPGRGEGGRDIVSPSEASAGTPYFFDSKNAGKRSVALDIKTDEGRALLRDIVEEADVLVENYVPGTLDDLGLGPDGLRAANPGLIYCSISGFGHDAIDTDRRAYDAILQALSGLMTVTGTAGDPPTKVGASVVDNLAGYVAATGVLAALSDRERTGEGRHVDVSMQDCAAWLVAPRLPFENRRTPHQPAAAPSLVSGIFPTRDGWTSLSVPDREAWGRLAGLLSTDREELTSAEAEAAIADWAAGRSVEAVVETWRDRGLPAARVESIEAVAGSGQLDARGAFHDVECRDGTRRLPRSPFGTALPDRSERPVRGGPALGEHTDDVLVELGYDTDEVAALREDGVVE